jgi:beta-lactamase class A
MLIAGVALIGAAAAYRTPSALGDPTDSGEPDPRVQGRLGDLERTHGAIIGVHCVDFDTGRNINYRDAELFAVCSTFKTYAAASVLQKAQWGQLRLDDEVQIDPAALVANSPVTQAHAGATLTLAELCRAALQQSDNTAGNLLLQAIGGPQAIADFARQLGDDATRLDRWETELNSAVPGDPRDTSTPHMLGRGYRNLLTTDVLAPPQRQQLEDWMRGNVTSSMRPGLPAGWTCADKTGSGDYGSTNDIGMVYGPDGRRVILSVMTRSQRADPKAPNLRPLITEVARFALPYVTGGTEG